MLPFNSVFVKRYDEEGRDTFIHSNFFGDMFDKDNPYAETQYHVGTIEKNRIYEKPKS